MFRDGIPILMRTPCHGKVRDRVFAPLDVKESRYNDRYRLLEVETQTLAWPAGETDLPIAGAWTYGQVEDNVSTDEYADLPPIRLDYLDLLESPVVP
jgi:hypothetical protein